ncbi:hypothetical protein L6164_000197 [Bauhinia variegata]|uniref:Uncharacterized protein n=1 Tax=Bauhinia variegata TaxID=167791 RepID=A0ACB9Q5S2_BAUVA|nr:hypothetical protein L6164_000197 [Bauhinia variegata]
MATTTLARHLSATIKGMKGSNRVGPWYNPHMAAASHAISERISLVDLIVEVRDARIPLSSEYEILKSCSSSLKRIIVLNKMDLADRAELQAWMKYFKETNCIAYGVNSHNKENIKQFLSFLQSQVRELKRTDLTSYTATIMLVGIPNVEKGKLRRATVSPEPGETKDIRSFKIGSHPNIYVLDTPGVLPPEVPEIDTCSKLILTGAIKDCMVCKKELARYFLAILNSGEQYKKWANLSNEDDDGSFRNGITENISSSKLDMKQRRQSLADHTQDFIVQNVKRTLFETISSFDGDIRDGEELAVLMSKQFCSLQNTFNISTECEGAHVKVAEKLLNLFRTGRLGHYTLDLVPRNLK